MERITFAEITDLAEYMIRRVEDKWCVVATLFFIDAVELMRNLLSYENVRIGSVYIADNDFDRYDGEYYVSLTDDYTLCVERALSDGKYLETGDALLLLDGDAKYAIAIENKDAECIEIAIGDDDFFPDITEPEYRYEDDVPQSKRGYRSLLNFLFN